MSRKGNDLVRRLLYTSAQCAAKWNPPVRVFVRAADGRRQGLQRGDRPLHGQTASAGFALWKKDCDFDPQFEIQSKAETTGESDAAETQGTEETKMVVGHREADKPQGEVVTTTASKIPSSVNGSNLRPLNFGLLRQQVSIALLESIGWHAESTHGGQWRGSCPLHEAEGTTSRCFAVHTDKNIYCCHRCGSQGNALDLWTALCGKPLLEAAWELVEHQGLNPPLLKEGPPGANH